MYVNDNGFEPTQSFAYELKGNSAVILRCFSRDTKAEIPEMLEGHPVTEVGAYAFSAHMDEAAFKNGEYHKDWMRKSLQSDVKILKILNICIS